jgi:hypothetical protein
MTTWPFNEEVADVIDVRIDLLNTSYHRAAKRLNPQWVNDVIVATSNGHTMRHEWTILGLFNQKDDDFFEIDSYRDMLSSLIALCQDEDVAEVITKWVKSPYNRRKLTKALQEATSQSYRSTKDLGRRRRTRVDLVGKEPVFRGPRTRRFTPMPAYTQLRKVPDLASCMGPHPIIDDAMWTSTTAWDMSLDSLSTLMKASTTSNRSVDVLPGYESETSDTISSGAKRPRVSTKST